MTLQAQEAFHTADLTYTKLKPNHVFLRAEFLASRFIDPSLTKQHHKAITCLLSLEAIWDTYCQIQAIRNLSTSWCILVVEFSTPEGMAVATSCQEVEDALSSSLQTRFTRVHGSPFLKPPLAPLVGAFGTGLAPNEILNGTFMFPPNTNHHTCLFIEALQFPSAEARVSQVSLVFWPEEYIAHWKGAKERTSSSPSGLHFGHYKSATYSAQIAHLHARFTQLIFMMGLSISQFQVGLQVILEKSRQHPHGQPPGHTTNGR